MSSFLRDFLLLTLAVVVSSFWIYKLQEPGILKKIDRVNNSHINIINLGTSHGSCFDYSVISLNGENFSRAGNTLYYDLQNYTFLKKKLADCAIIVIPVSYYVFGLDENRTDRGENNPFVNFFYYYLPAEQIYAYSPDKFKDLIVYRTQKNFKRLFSWKRTKKELSLSLSDHKLQLAKHAERRSRRHQRLGEFSTPGKNIRYLGLLISSVQKSGHRPILVTVPYYFEYKNGFSDEWLQEHYYNYLSSLKKKFNVEHLDYSFDTRFFREASLFEDSDHLNDTGKKKFSRIFNDDLQERGFFLECAKK
ncbi:hypothetical protein GKODMF_08360 [Candidatus Electrothrix gigas]